MQQNLGKSMLALIMITFLPTAQSAELSYDDLAFELSQVTEFVSANYDSQEELATAEEDLDRLLEADWAMLNRNQYKEMLLRITQVRMHIETEMELLADTEFDNKSAKPAPRLIKCQNKSFQTVNKKITDKVFCAGVTAASVIEKNAKRDTFFRRATTKIFGEDFFELSTPNKIMRITSETRYWRELQDDPFFILQLVKREADNFIAAEAKRKREERERLEEILRYDREAFDRERRAMTRGDIDRNSYRLGVGEERSHTA